MIETYYRLRKVPEVGKSATLPGALSHNASTRNSRLGFHALLQAGECFHESSHDM